MPVAVRLGTDSPEATARLAREMAELGFHWQTACSCGDVAQDLQTLIAIREATPDRTQLQFDAASLYDMETARDLCAELEGFGLSLVLDPLKSRDLDRVAALRRQTSVPLGVWRGIRSPADVLALVRCGAAPFAVVDLQLVGGLTAARKCAAVAQAAGLGAALATGPSLGIAAAAMLQLGCATPTLLRLQSLRPVAAPRRGDHRAAGHLRRDGRGSQGSGPGHRGRPEEGGEVSGHVKGKEEG